MRTYLLEGAAVAFSAALTASEGRAGITAGIAGSMSVQRAAHGEQFSEGALLN